MTLNSPVLLIAYNRPETTQLVFNEIRKAKPKRIYFSVDGPRIGNAKDDGNCKRTREIINQVDWDCEVFTNFPENNLGCAVGVSNAITWAFRNEDRMIILEDDTVPVQAFFPYCDYLLEKYKNDTRVCMISGNNYTDHLNPGNDSYFFSLYGHIWGWASWKRVWDKFDLHMTDWALFRDTHQIRNVFSAKAEQKYYINFYENFLITKAKGTWDYQWFYCRFKEAGLSIVPKNNLVSNVGIKGTHTDIKFTVHFFSVNENFKILKEPDFVLRNSYYDKYHFKQHIHKKKYLLNRIIRKLLRMIKIVFNQG
jgi:hypothetical protein